MPSSTCPDRHSRRRRALSGAPRLTGDKLSQAQIDLLMSKVSEDPTTGCWLWQATVNEKGYPIVVWLTRCYRVHKLMHERAEGSPVPPGYDVDHTCNNRRCINPAHTERCSHQENIRRIRGRDAAPLPFDWRAHRDYTLALAHLDSIEGEP